MELNFKEWLTNEVRYKGLYRMWKEKNPNMPNYVGHDLYTHNFSYAMRNLLKNTKDNGSDNRTPFSPIPSNSPEKILDSRRAKEIKNVIWPKKTEIINISPKDFEPETLSIMTYRNFGFKTFDQIPRDAERMDIQRKLTNKTGKNEPVIFVRTESGLKLIEGWHRTMLILLQGAPENQLGAIKNGDFSEVDFSQWTPMPINSYIGINQQTFKAEKVNKSHFDANQTQIWSNPMPNPA